MKMLRVTHVTIGEMLVNADLIILVRPGGVGGTVLRTTDGQDLNLEDYPTDVEQALTALGVEVMDVERSPRGRG